MHLLAEHGIRMLITQDVALTQADPIIVIENPGTTSFDVFSMDDCLIGADGLRFTHSDWNYLGHATGRVQ
jgi:hypothetical protein